MKFIGIFPKCSVHIRFADDVFLQPQLLETVHTGGIVLLNGAEGAAVINPDSQALQRFERSLDEVQKRKETMAQVSLAERTVTLDGIEVTVMANVRT